MEFWQDDNGCGADARENLTPSNAYVIIFLPARAWRSQNTDLSFGLSSTMAKQTNHCWF